MNPSRRRIWLAFIALDLVVFVVVIALIVR
jgi:hypothetical protein